MSHITEKEHVHVDLKRNVPTAADADIRIMDKVLIYSERPVIKWFGPYTVQDVRDKSVFSEVYGRTTQLEIDKLRLYRHEDDPDDEHDVFGNTPDPEDQDYDPEWDEHGWKVDRYWNLDRGPYVEGVNILTVEIINPTDPGHEARTSKSQRRDKSVG